MGHPGHSEAGSEADAALKTRGEGRSVAELAALVLERAEQQGVLLPDTPAGQPGGLDESGDVASTESPLNRRLRGLCEKRGVPHRHAEKLLTGQLMRSEAQVVYRQWIASGQPGAVLVLSGPVGSGKTLAAVEAVIDGPPTGYFGGTWPPELGPRFIDASMLQRMGLYDREGHYELIARCSMLAIDDLGVEWQDDKGVMRSVLDGVLDRRYRGVGWTIVTTNLKVRDFEARFGARIMSRLRERGNGFRTVRGNYREAAPAAVTP